MAESIREWVERFVLVDALALFDGERVWDIVTPSTAITFELTVVPSRTHAVTRLFAVLDATTHAWALERYTPDQIGIYDQPVRPDAFWDQAWQASVRWVAGPPLLVKRVSAEQQKTAGSNVGRPRYGSLSDAQLARYPDEKHVTVRRRTVCLQCMPRVSQ